MKKLFFLAICFALSSTILGQEIQEYKYIRVPVKYDFLKEENQYQVNALTAFLFEQKGYKVLYRENIPAGIDPCDVLKADVHSDSGLFRSRLYFTLENCKKETVFTSETGVSREKDFKTSYHQALREAFNSLEEVVNPTGSEMEIVIDPVTTSDEIDALDKQPEEIIVDPVVTAQEIASEESKENSSEENSGKNEFPEDQRYINGTVNYLLKKTSAGFDLFKEGNKEKIATLLKSGGGDNYLYTSEKISGNAFFDTSGNLIVEYLDPKSQQLISVIYKLKA